MMTEAELIGVEQSHISVDRVAGELVAPGRCARCWTEWPCEPARLVQHIRKLAVN